MHFDNYKCKIRFGLTQLHLFSFGVIMYSSQLHPSYGRLCSHCVSVVTVTFVYFAYVSHTHRNYAVIRISVSFFKE